MLENCKTAHERWGGVHQLIDNWLAERKKLIVLYCNLSASKPLSAEQSLGENVGCFCQVMIDYCSAGHFEIYEQLINEAREYQDGGVELAEKLVPQLDKLTGDCVDFNDTYDADCSFEQLAKLPADLSQIGEVLEDRFALEDQLIEQLHNAHKDLLAEEA